MGISQYTFIKKNGEPSGTEYRSSIGRRRDCFYGRGRPWKCSGGSDLDEKAEDLELIAEPVMNEKRKFV